MAIVVDAMGAEKGVYISVRGGLEALRFIKDDIVFVGDVRKINLILERHAKGSDASRIIVMESTDVITMQDKPKESLKKKNSSLALAMKYVAEDKGSAFVSAGNTGAILAYSMFTLGRLKGVGRPCIACAIPTSSGGKVILGDAGANVSSRPTHLAQFAIMTEIFAKYVYSMKAPNISLISNGSEKIKGTDETQKAYRILESLPDINFKGYIEGTGMLGGKIDIAVCDGFIGNIILKTIEGVAATLGMMTKEAMRSKFLYSAGGFLAKGALKTVKNKVDYSEFGGAPFLGVKGTVFVCHGGSNVNALKNGIIKASSFLRSNANDEIEQRIKEYNLN